MKLIRFGEPGRERPGVLLHDGTRIDVSAAVRDYDEAFLGGTGVHDLERWLATNANSAPRIAPTTRLGPPIARPSKIVCIGLNYADHARETGAAIPAEPVLFAKATTALSGPNDPVKIPRGGTKLDYEVELAVIIGKTARYVPLENALEHVAGFALHNDYSERAFQLEHGGQWVKGKSCDTFAPLGPFLATQDEVRDFRRLRLWLNVNGQKRQDSNTDQMVFDVPQIVAYCSRFMTLLPGDVISTGTPPGVGLGFNPPNYLNEGDVVDCGIDGLGSAQQRVVRESDG
ncbi:MAG: fumarylacetoacetate hydrolase family protein [Planctomycetes bacterium]|nr:fumarylacetoacetate hydrolase family protein [Planctomycetota bacterium]